MSSSRKGRGNLNDVSELMPPCQLTTPPRSRHRTKRQWREMTRKCEEVSILAKRLRLDVVWGRMPAHKAQQYAADAIADGAKPTPQLKHMSKLGCSGRHPMGCWSDFCRHYDTSFVSSVLTSIRIPLKGQSEPGYLQIAPPHALFSAMYEEDEREFNTAFGTWNTDNLKLFWESQRDHPAYRDHCMHHHPYRDFREYAIPINLHGDEVATVGCGRSWAKLSHCVSWASLLGFGITQDRRHMAFQIYSCLCKGSYGRDTLSEILRVLAWSLNAMYLGVWPSKDWNGKPYTSGYFFDKAGSFLAGGHYCIWWASQVDLDYMQKGWNGAKYNTNAEPCNACSCNSTTKPWADCRPKIAVWLNHLWTRLSYAASHPDRNALFRDVESGGILTYIPDVLHVKHLGTDQSMYASAVYLLTHHSMPGEPEDNLRVIFHSTQAEYRKQRIPQNDRYRCLNPTMVKQSKAKLPLLKGKAAKVKSFGFALVHVFQQHMNPSDPKHHLVLKGLKISVRIDTIMHQHADEYRYPPDIAEEFELACFNYCRVVGALIRAYHKAVPPVPVFNYTIKAHYLMHLGVCARYTNPAFGSCYDGETLMQTCKKLFQASCRGNGPLAASNQAMYRFVMGRAFKFLDAKAGYR